MTQGREGELRERLEILFGHLQLKKAYLDHRDGFNDEKTANAQETRSQLWNCLMDELVIRFRREREAGFREGAEAMAGKVKNIEVDFPDSVVGPVRMSLASLGPEINEALKELTGEK